MTEIEKFLEYTNGCQATVIVDGGARDCEASIAFSTRFPEACVYAFECNPENVLRCRDAIRNWPNIELFEYALCDENCEIPFYRCTSGNDGAGSLYEASGKYPVEKITQEKIMVQGLRLDTVMWGRAIKQIDLLWLDLQGAELLALKGLGRCIERVSFLHLEMEFMLIYHEQPLYREVDQYLVKRGFRLLGWTEKNEYFGNAVYGRV